MFLTVRQARKRESKHTHQKVGEQEALTVSLRNNNKTTEKIQNHKERHSAI